MIKGIIYHLIFIAVPGVIIFTISGIITYHKYNTPEILSGSVYFIFTSFCIWRGCNWIHLKLRQSYIIKQNPFFKIISLFLTTGLYSFLVAGTFSLAWMKFSKEEFAWEPVSRYTFFSIVAAIISTLVYETVYLGKERDVANTVAAQLDDELTRAEMTALRNELDPHFIFNSLNTLSHLITHNALKANLFNNKLAQVYKYFLVNKEEKLVPVSKEIDFIRSYFYLLKIRHGENMRLNIDADLQIVNDILIIPCALQILVENAIKHNDFTPEQPLIVYIKIDGKFISIQNTPKKKQVKLMSTGVGLRNLHAQYLLVSNKNIVIDNNETRFTVKLPLIKVTKTAVA